MKKKTPPLPHIPSPRTPIVIGPIDEVLLDLDFDDLDETVNFEPTVRCLRGGRVTYMETEDDEDPEE